MKRLLPSALLVLALPLVAAPAALTAPAAAPDPYVAPAEVAPVPIALLIDVGSGQTLFAKEPDRRFVPASITKVMTLYVAFELIARHQLDPHARLRMSEGAWKAWAHVGSTMFLDREHDVTVDELLLGNAPI